MDRVLEIKNLAVSYGGKWVLDAFYLNVSRGETVWLMGRTGAGKTTVLRAVAGVLPAVASLQGEILINGIRTDQMTPKQRTNYLRGRAGIMLQDSKTSLDPTACILKQLREAVPSGDKKEALSFLERAGFSDSVQIARRRPHELSGGMLQRICLVMALASGRDLLILDEPFSQVDLKTKQQLMEILKAWQKQHHTAVLIITHDEQLAALPNSRIIRIGV